MLRLMWQCWRSRSTSTGEHLVLCHDIIYKLQRSLNQFRGLKALKVVGTLRLRTDLKLPAFRAAAVSAAAVPQPTSAVVWWQTVVHAG
jgi:hypothetical protein